MERAFGLYLPRTLVEVCDPRRTAVLVDDIQVGIVSQMSSGATIVQRVDLAAQVTRMSLRDSPGFPITPQLLALPRAGVIDKITMSAFSRTPFAPRARERW